ncbi:unnamed protein product [Mytilus coruscus]|uniref:Integrase zinc-binding domain-containing protein n=1 Tax=Mytilus coruscus TaxID=42192 RepID=A0A6J8AM80_MYTCO|nr:unnamed protein product [Mytilus coruscus]
MPNSDILPTNTTEIPKDLQVTALQACIGVIEDSLDNDISQSESSDISCNSISVLPKYTPEDIKNTQMQDPIIKRFFMYYSQGRKPSRLERKCESNKVISMLRQAERIKIVNGILYRNVSDPQHGQLSQLVLPEVLKEQVLMMLHSQAGHQGIERTINLVRSRFYWTGMFSDIENFCKDCERCNVSKMPIPKVRPAMNHLLASSPNEILAMDFTLLEQSSDGPGEKLRAEAVKRSSEQKYTPNPVLLEGSNVLLRNRVIGRNKIQDAWDARKYIIIKRIDPNKHVYLVEPLEGGERRIENRMNIKPCVLVNNAFENERRESKGQRLRNSIQCSSNEESDNESDEDDPIAIGYEGSQPLRRSARSNAGTHSNVHHLPR